MRDARDEAIVEAFRAVSQLAQDSAVIACWIDEPDDEPAPAPGSVAYAGAS